MGAQQPPQGFYGSGNPPPPPTSKRRGPLILIFALAGVVALVVVGAVLALFLVTAGRAESAPEAGEVPQDGKRYYRMRWQVEGSPVDTTLRGLWSSGQTVHAVGDGGVIITRDSTGSWTAQRSGTQAHLHAVTSTPAGMMAVSASPPDWMYTLSAASP